MDIQTLRSYAIKLLTAPDCSIDYNYGLSPFLNIVSTKKNVIFFAWDHCDGFEFSMLPPEQQSPSIIEDIKKKVLKNPDQIFWIFHSWLNFEKYFDQELPNLKLIKYTDEVWLGGCRNLYSTVDPQFDKNFNSTRHWISLGTNRRIARYIAALYLLGTSVTTCGLLKIDPTELCKHDTWESYLSYWKFNSRYEIFDIESSFSILKDGFHKIKQGLEYEARIYHHSDTPAMNHKNFDNFLRILYRDSFVEIVNETLFMETSGIITEKFINSVYGFNFPIMLGVPNTVTHLRNLGFDMFDDVIDHSYDTIVSPLPRLVQALGSNITLLQDSELAKNAWRTCQHRMKNNVELAKQLELAMPDRVANVLTELNNIINQI